MMGASHNKANRWERKCHDQRLRLLVERFTSGDDLDKNSIDVSIGLSFSCTGVYSVSVGAGLCHMMKKKEWR